MNTSTGTVEPSPAEMCRAMGSFATGVTVVAGIDDGEPVGFACQSFASVSLTPPLVLFCVAHSGRSWPRIRRSGRFDVSVLGADQDDVCARFGSGRGAKFEGLDWHRSAGGTPVIPGALMRVHCTVEAVHGAGDHDVVIGRVREIATCEDDRRPMIFYRGRFGLAGPRRPGTVPAGAWSGGDNWG